MLVSPTPEEFDLRFLNTLRFWHFVPLGGDHVIFDDNTNKPLYEGLKSSSIISLFIASAVNNGY